MSVIRVEDLPCSAIAHELVGADHGVGVTCLIVDAPPGRGPELHKHPYEEIFIVQEGEGTFVVGEEELVVRAGEVAIVPPDTPHKFVNSGDGPLRQVDIHVSPSFSTEWL